MPASRLLSAVVHRAGVVPGRVRALARAGVTGMQAVPFWWRTAVSVARRPTGRWRTTANLIVRENRLAGSRRKEWDIAGAGDQSIVGFATDMSVDVGETVTFKIDTDAADYRIDIYRLGYYRGRGARKVAAVTPSAPLPQQQPPPLSDHSVGLVDCGNWSVSAQWTVPADCVSGVYLAKLTRADTGGASHVPFIVRDDRRPADIVFQTADPTWQAYNRYGGADFYTGSPTDRWDSPSRARKLSYNRPFLTRGDELGRSYLFSAEYPLIRFLERNGYDVTYLSGVDVDRRGPTALTNHQLFLSVGHDEYWSSPQRANVEAGLAAGVHLMFLSGNEVYWRTRFEPSIDDSRTPHRTLVCYKETWDDAPTDPSTESTATWRDPRFLRADESERGPENELTGTLTMANDTDLAITVSAAEGKLRLWRGTGLDTMRRAQVALAPHTVGYESDEDVDNGFRPAGLIRLSTTVGPSPEHLQDFGTKTAVGRTTHHLTLYRAASGALVFGAGTIQWTWGLDRHHDGARTAADVRLQQATVNQLADMNVLPASLMRGLVPAEPTADHEPPTSVITSPRPGQVIANGDQITVAGTAQDLTGVVAGVEVSLDGGDTWHPATGSSSWSYTAVMHGHGPVAIRSRATDDSANTESPGPGVEVSVVGPFTLFGGEQPVIADSGDPTPAELGVRFRSTIDGYVEGVRFYKAPANRGIHTGSLWTGDGTCLATGTFVDETAEGWQSVRFGHPIPIRAGETYLASYFAPQGHFAVQANFFYYRDHRSSPLIAEATVPGGSTGNGRRRAGPGCPDTAESGNNYFVDPIFVLVPSAVPAGSQSG